MRESGIFNSTKIMMGCNESNTCPPNMVLLESKLKENGSAEIGTSFGHILYNVKFSFI